MLQAASDYYNQISAPSKRDIENKILSIAMVTSKKGAITMAELKNRDHIINILKECHKSDGSAKTLNRFADMAMGYLPTVEETTAEISSDTDEVSDNISEETINGEEEEE